MKKVFVAPVFIGFLWAIAGCSLTDINRSSRPWLLIELQVKDTANPRLRYFVNSIDLNALQALSSWECNLKVDQLSYKVQISYWPSDEVYPYRYFIGQFDEQKREWVSNTSGSFLRPSNDRRTSVVAGVSVTFPYYRASLITYYEPNPWPLPYGSAEPFGCFIKQGGEK